MRTALLVIDVQNDFCPGGALAVEDGDAVVPLINQLIPRFDVCVFTQDWHPPSHSSFASSHDGKAPFEFVELSYGEQVLWPDHCVQGSAGAEFHADLDEPARSWSSARATTRHSTRIRPSSKTTMRHQQD